MEEGGEPHPSIALNRRARVPARGGGEQQGGAGSSSLKNVFYLYRGGHCVSIYNWPQGEWLKRGNRPPQVKITAHRFLGAHGVKASATIQRVPTVPSTSGGGHEDLVELRDGRASLRLHSRKMSWDLGQGHKREEGAGHSQQKGPELQGPARQPQGFLKPHQPLDEALGLITARATPR